jgi:hypothetical protein
MNLNESLPTGPDGEEKISWDEFWKREKEANARSRKKTDAKWARRRAEDLFDYHGGLMPWHETEADKEAEISAQQNQAMYSKIFQMSFIGGNRAALDGMMEAFTLSPMDKSNSRERN